MCVFKDEEEWRVQDESEFIGQKCSRLSSNLANIFQSAGAIGFKGSKA